MADHSLSDGLYGVSVKQIQALFMVVHSELGVCEVYARGKEDN